MKRTYALGPLAILAGSCQGVDSDRSHDVVIVGDSISVDNRNEFQASIPDVLVDAVWGRGPDVNAFGDVPTFREAWPNAVSHAERWVVIQDDGGEQPITVEFAEWVVDQVPDHVCIGWVSPSNNGRDYIAESQNIVRMAIAEHPCSAYIDWHAVATPDLLTDGLHLNQQGQYVLNHLVWSATR